MIRFDKKGILAPFTVLTSIFTGVFFPLLGSFAAIDLDVVKGLYYEGVVLVVVGGFLAQWIFAHTIHDIYHMKIDERITFSKRTLKMLFVFSLVVLLSIAIYLTWQRGWPVFVFSIIGAVVSMYAEGLLHHESQMAFGAMFLVIGSFYVQVGTLALSYIVWIRVLCMAVFAFLSQYGWLLFYRLDDYGYDQGKKNKSILVAKSALFFLIVYLLL